MMAGPMTRKPGAVPAEKVGHERYSAVPPTAQLTVSTRAPDAAPVKQFLDTRHPASVTPKPAPYSAQSASYSHTTPAAGYYTPSMYDTSYYYQYYGHYPYYPNYPHHPPQ